MKVSEQRIFYVVVTSAEMVLLHAYKKESQKTPRKEIQTATQRMKEVVGEK